MHKPSRVSLAVLLILIGGCPLAGCGDDDPAAATADGDKPAASAAPKFEKWLQPNSKLAAAQWMASRNAKAVKPVTDPDVQEIDADLASAHALYRESERMIANRSVQVEDMLKDIGVTEPAADILDDLTKIAGEVGQTEGFGAVSQHYFNLRSSGISRPEALASLKSRYGMRK